MKAITLSKGQVTKLIKALTLCYCGGVDDCPDCDERREAINMLSGIKTTTSSEVGDNEGIVHEEEEVSSWDKIEEAFIQYELNT